MKKLTALGTGMLAIIMLSSFAKDPVRSLKHVMDLQMPEGLGSNGAAVAYNPSKKLYYAVFAGNSKFPLAVFDRDGNRKEGKFEAGFDARGIWYNRKHHVVEGNSYSDHGYFRFPISKNGMPLGKPLVMRDGMNQPNENSIGSYNQKTGEVIFREGDLLSFYNLNGEKLREMQLKGLPAAWDQINDYSIVYTGLKRREAAVYDFTLKRIYLFSLSDGNYSATLQLPEDAPVPEAFNFSYANGIFWLFDQSQRKWCGYK